MKTEATTSLRVSLLQVVNDSQTPVDQSVLRILYKGNSVAKVSPPSEGVQKHEATSWDYAWFANYE